MSNIIIAAIFTIIIGIVFGLCKKYFDMDIARLYDGLALYFLILILINTINKNNAE